MAGEQSSVGMQQRPKALEHAPLRRAIEIDHRVSAEDRVERAANRPYGGHQLHRAKAHEGAHLGAYPRVARFVSRALQEEALQALFAELLDALERVDAEVRGAYSAGIEIRPEDAHPRIRTQGFDRGDGHRIGFLRSEEHTSELQSREKLVCRLLLEKKKPAGLRSRST